MEQNYPNPFNPLTTIVFEIPSIACVRIDLYDILGQKVKTLVHEVRESGRHRIVLDAAQADLPSGIYIYQIEVAGKTITRKMMLLK